MGERHPTWTSEAVHREVRLNESDEEFHFKDDLLLYEEYMQEVGVSVGSFLEGQFLGIDYDEPTAEDEVERWLHRPPERRGRKDYWKTHGMLAWRYRSEVKEAQP